MENSKKQLLITQILSRAFNICKDNFLEVLKVIGVFIVPVFILTTIIIVTSISTVFLSPSSDSSILNSAVDTLGLGIILIVIIMAILLAFLSLFGFLVITKILDDANKGYKVSWKSAIKYVWQRKWRLLGLNILSGVITFLIAILLIFLCVMISLITFGIGAIIAIPSIIAIFFIFSTISNLLNSVFIVKDLGVLDTIKETVSLFKKGYFWSTIGRLAAISGIYVGVSMLLGMLQILPIAGFIITILGQFILSAYISAYFNIFVLDRDNSINENLFIEPTI